MKIRPAAETDIPAIAGIHVEGWQAAYGGIIDQAYIDSKTLETRMDGWRDIFKKNESKTLVAESGDGQVTGFISFGKLRTPPPGMSPIRPLYSSEVYALYLLPSCWRQGIGTALLRAAARDLADNRHKSLCLWVLEKNERGVAFYKKTGGERCGKKDVEFGPTTAREICFGWRDTSTLL